MKSKIPDYYEEFHCIAGQCKHSCCIGWEIDVDKNTYKSYCSMEDEFGERLKQSIKKDKALHFQMNHGKCPFLSKEHLCTVYQQLGPQEMSDVCAEYPRFEIRYGNREEKTLTLSCEEVGRILLSKKDKITWLEKDLPELRENEIEMDEVKEDGKRIYHDPGRRIELARDKSLDLLQDRTKTLRQRVEEFLHFSSEIQAELDADSVDRQMESKPSEKKTPDQQIDVHRLFQKRMDVVEDMVVVEEEWEEDMNNVMRAFDSDSHRETYLRISAAFEEDQKDHEYEYEHLIVYFAYRYLIEAVFDQDFLTHARFCVLCYLILRDMDRMKYLIHGQVFTLEDRIESVRIFSRQVEHSKSSMDYLEQKIRTEDIFDPERMILCL